MAGSFFNTGSSGGGAGSGNVITLDAYASTPASPSTGDTLISTDGPLHRIYDGTNWLDFLPGAGPPVPAMPTAGWTQVGTAPTSLTAAAGIRSIVPAAGGDVGYERTPGSTSWKSRVYLKCLGLDTNPDTSFGLYLEENATSEALGININRAAGTTTTVYTIDRPNGATSGVGQVLVTNQSPGVPMQGPGVWLEAEYNAANVGSECVLRYGHDGVNFIEIATYNAATYFTTAPDLIVPTFGPGGAPTQTVYTHYLYSEIAL